MKCASQEIRGSCANHSTYAPGPEHGKAQRDAGGHDQQQRRQRPPITTQQEVRRKEQQERLHRRGQAKPHAGAPTVAAPVRQPGRAHGRHHVEGDLRRQREGRRGRPGHQIQERRPAPATGGSATRARARWPALAHSPSNRPTVSHTSSAARSLRYASGHTSSIVCGRFRLSGEVRPALVAVEAAAACRGSVRPGRGGPRRERCRSPGRAVRRWCCARRRDVRTGRRQSGPRALPPPGRWPPAAAKPTTGRQHARLSVGA